MMSMISYALGLDLATTIHQAFTGMSGSAILTSTATAGHPMDGCTHIPVTTGTGIDGTTTATATDTTRMDTIADIRTSYTPAMPPRLEELSRRENQAIDAQEAALGQEDMWDRLGDRREVR